MNAISIRQPWASAITLGIKRVETRSWSTKYRGPLVIHASKQLTRECREFWGFERWLRGLPERLPLGAAIAVVDLVDVHRTEEYRGCVSALERLYGNFSPGRFAWVLANVRPLPEPIGYRGRQGFFDIPDALIQSQEASCPK